MSNDSPTIRGFLRSRNTVAETITGKDALASSPGMSYEGGNASKVASSDPLMPNHGTPVEESPEAQKLRRLGELLKKVVPTKSTGSTNPTPPRGTP